MGTMVRMTRPAAYYERETRTRHRTRIRWRFRWRGLLGVLLVAVILLNLYVLLDNAVRLVKLRIEQAALNSDLARAADYGKTLEQRRNQMKSADYLREQASMLGYVTPGETASTPSAERPYTTTSPLKRKSRPSQAY